MASTEGTNSRHRVNLLSFLVTSAVLFVAVRMSSGSFATRINKISENLDRALAEVMDERRPNFTELTDNGVYVSDAVFHPKGMAGLYNITMDFMDLIFSKDIYPEGFLKIGPNNQIQLGDYKSEWQSLLSKYVGLLVVIIILALIIVFMPLCGLCFCCCRCCGKCGARSQPFDKKHDLCKKIVLATILICLGTLLLFGVVCAFVSNQQLQEGVDDVTENLRKGVKDVNTYLNSTKNQIDTLLNTNYGEFEEVLLHTIHNSSNVVYGELENYSNAISMTELANIVNSLPTIMDGFTTLKISTNTLRVLASQLSDAVRQVKKDLLSILNSPECNNIKKCQEVSNNVSSLQTNIHFNNLPDITKQIEDLDNFASNTNLIDAVTRGKDKLENIKQQIGQTVNRTLDLAHDNIKRAGQEIKNGAKNITGVVDDLQVKITTNTKPALNTADKYIRQYGPYRYYVGLSISCLLLVISLCIALGLICGICGKRPDGYGDDCCNKGAGSQFLICGVMLMFIAGLVIAVAVLFCFLVGVVTQRIVCDPMNDPEHSQVFSLIDQADFSEYYIDFKISEAFTNCHKNKSIYDVFHLKKKFDLDQVKGYLTKFDINKTLAGLDLSSVNIDQNFSLLSPEDKAQLYEVSNSDFADINFDEFKSLLAEDFTTVNLTDLSNELGTLIEQIPTQNGKDTATLVHQLQVSKMNIEMYQQKIVEPMVKNASDVVELAKTLEEDLKMNHPSFRDAMQAMLAELDLAEKTLRVNGTTFLKDIARNFTDGILSQVQAYLDRIYDKTTVEVGQCGPLSLVINATLTSTCEKILLPWNGFWFGLMWSVLLFIPTIIISVKLATLYQKHSAYSRDLIEAEYLYDAYVDRDNIPLNSRNNKSKKKNKKQKRYEDRPAVPSAGGDMVVREYAAGSNAQDTRYADMAPKQWEDFPAGGPPQYQRAPTEYERPPPYYFPGAGESTQ